MAARALHPLFRVTVASVLHGHFKRRTHHLANPAEMLQELSQKRPLDFADSFCRNRLPMAASVLHPFFCLMAAGVLRGASKGDHATTYHQRAVSRLMAASVV